MSDMSNPGRSLRGATALAGCLFCAGVSLWGCQGVPPVPPHAANRQEPDVYVNPYDTDNDEYSGRLFRTGKYRERPKRRSLQRSSGTAAPPATQPAMPSGPAHAPAPYPSNASPPPLPPGYQPGPRLAPPYGQRVPAGHPASHPTAPTYSRPPNPYSPGASPAPPYPSVPPRSSPYPGSPPQHAPPQYPYPPTSPYPAAGRPPADANQVIPTSATTAVTSADPTPSTASTEPASEVSVGEEEEDDGFELSDLKPANLAKSVKRATGRGPDENFARRRLEEGRALFAQKKYREAAEKLKEAAGRWPDSILAEDALFLRAESLFFSDQYPEAQDTYGQLLKDYKNSRYLDTVTRRLFAIGQYWDALHLRDPHWPVTPNFKDKSRPRFDTFGRALKAYETIRIEDPTGPLADDSLMAIAVAYFRRERYEDAAVFFDLVRTEYPDSEHQAKAHLLALKSKLRSYQGKYYDATPLEEAEEIADQTLAQFRRDLGSEAARVLKARDQIEHQKAERDWAVAQFYDNKQQYAAARIYYRSIVEDYPHTRFADMARRRMEEIHGEPDEPPNRYAWLTKVFEPVDDGEVQGAEANAPTKWAKDTLRNIGRDDSDSAEVR